LDLSSLSRCRDVSAQVELLVLIAQRPQFASIVENVEQRVEAVAHHHRNRSCLALGFSFIAPHGLQAVDIPQHHEVGAISQVAFLAQVSREFQQAAYLLKGFRDPG
jgi:hypothetical protein